MKNLAFIVHGKVKYRDKLIAGLKQVFGKEYEPVFFITEHEQEAIELSYKTVRGGASHIICVGGDGSLNEVVNGVMKAKSKGVATGIVEEDIRIGLLPHGTGNDFARTMKVNDSAETLRKWIDEDSYHEIDIGLSEFTDEQGERSSRYFINITDLGIGGVIAKKLKNSSKILGPTITYQKSILTALLTYRHVPVKVKADSFNYEGDMLALIVANGVYFGAGMGIAPDALPDDGMFSVVIAGNISIMDYVKNVGDIKKCKKINHAGVQYLSAREINIESAGAPLPIDMDGEFVGYSPMTVIMQHKAVKFLCPR